MQTLQHTISLIKFKLITAWKKFCSMTQTTLQFPLITGGDWAVLAWGHV